MDSGMAHKRCTRCGVNKPYSNFSRRKASTDGLQARCKSCARDSFLQYYEQHKAENTVRCTQWKRDNRDRVNELSRQRHCDNPDRQRAAQRAYELNHPDKYREMNRVKATRRRAKKRGVKEHFTVAMERHIFAFWGNKCAACGAERLPMFDNNFHIDHWLPLARGHALTMDNAVMLCPECNGRKSDRLPQDYFDAKTVARIEKRLEEQAMLWQRGAVA